MPSAAASSGSSYSLFPPIPASLQRLFDLVPLVTYPANALPDDISEEDPAEVLPTLYVFSSAADAASGRPSFNPTCLKWQTYLRLADVPVRLEPSTNHASPSGALPFLLPPRRRPADREPQSQSAGWPISAHELQAYVKEERKKRRSSSSGGKQGEIGQEELVDGPASSAPLRQEHRAPAYQALLDTRIRRAWLHAVYLHEKGSSGSGSGSGSGNGSGSIAARLYAHSASSSTLVRAALTRQLRAAAAAEVWGAQGSYSGGGAGGGQQNHHEVAQIYREAQAALQALAALLEEGKGREEEEEEEEEEKTGMDSTGTTTQTKEDSGPYFFGSREPTLFDAAVFSYTHLLLEDGDDLPSSSTTTTTTTPRFQWQDRTLPDAVRALPALVRHRARILERCWPELMPSSKAGSQASSNSGSQALADLAASTVSTSAASTTPETSLTSVEAPSVADSVTWVRL